MSPKLRVLVVDDDLSMAVTLSDVLEIEGYEVVIAHDGERAVTLLRENEFDVVLMDIRMPRMDGGEAYRVMRKEKPDVRLILMTAYYTDAIVQEAQKDDGVEIFFKPLAIDEITRLLRDVKECRPAA